MGLDASVHAGAVTGAPCSGPALAPYPRRPRPRRGRRPRPPTLAPRPERPRSVTALAWIPVIAALAACPGRSRGGPAGPPSDPYPGREQQLSALLLRDLEIEVLEGLQLPTFETGVPATSVSARVGAVHIGVGPEDVTAGTIGSVDRWPLTVLDEVGARLDRPQSKRLEMHLSEDLTTAWVADEISYRLPGCVGQDGRYKVFVIPLRMTSLFVRDGERWVPVLEHLSYPQRIADLVDGAEKPLGVRMRNGRDPRPDVNEPMATIKRALEPGLPADERARLFDGGPAALALWPDPAQELRRSAVVSGASLAHAFDASSIKLESWRLGMSPDPAGGVGGGNVAWMAATIKVDARRARGDAVETVVLRLRATFVLERRVVEGALRWQIVQSHVSSPVDDDALLELVVGASARDGKPWTRACLGEWRRGAAEP
jgi:hypothetical protein